MCAKTFRYFFLIAFMAGITDVVYAQRDTVITQEVEVVKSFRPTISDANKISSMPRIEDTQHEKPSFTYSIFSQPVYNAFSVNTLKAATYASESKEEEGFGLVRAGAGNYNRPYGEIFFNSQNIRNTLFGLHGKHLSSHGKLELEGGDKVDAPFSENNAELFVKHLFRNSVLSVNLGFDHNGFNYYGYPVDPIPDILTDENQQLFTGSGQINYLGTRQTFSKGSFNIGLENTAARRNDATFGFDFLYHYFGTKTGQREHFGEFMADVKKPFYTGTGFLEAGVTFVKADEIFNRNQMAPGKNQQTWLTAKPSFMLGGDVANIRLGLNAWFVVDSSTDMVAKLSPTIRANFSPVKEIINIFAGMDGNFINNHYSKIAYENPFVNPQQYVKNSMEYRFFGGFDGKLAAKTNFKISAGYNIVKEQPLYYLFKYGTQDATLESGLVDNTFGVIYDNLNLLKFNVEVFHASINKVNLLLSGSYFVYDMETMEEAWHMPDWESKLSLTYQASDQLAFSADVFLTGQRKALILAVSGDDPRPLSNADLLGMDPQREIYNLPTVFDLNFNASYKITNRFSVFAQLNNFGFQKYQRWLGYPVQSFNVLGGISYAF